MTLNKEQTRQIMELIQQAFTAEEVLATEIRPSKIRAAKHNAALSLIRSRDTLQFILEEFGTD